MSSGFLLADCVIDNLVEIGFIKKSDWKDNTREFCYNVTFFLAYKQTTVVFEITVEDGIHKVTETRLRTLECRHNKNFSNIFSECVIPEIIH
ncbi:MAG: hypothetical protein FWG49_07670 [Leptospirales bacterium]|nr:hypothetical protein [Leptospirales bacterium]